MDSYVTTKHLCLLYDSSDQYRQTLTSYLKLGHRKKEKIIYLSGNTQSDLIFRSNQKKVLFLKILLEEGHLKIISREDIYNNQKKSLVQMMLTFLENETEKAIKEGYTGLRIARESNSLLKETSIDDLIEYEIAINNFFKKNRCICLCMYNSNRLSYREVLHVLHTHPYVDDHTEIYTNDYYIPPEAYVNNTIDDIKPERLNNIDSYNPLDQYYGSIYIEHLKEELKKMYDKGYTMKDQEIVDASQYLDKQIVLFQLS